MRRPAAVVFGAVALAMLVASAAAFAASDLLEGLADFRGEPYRVDAKGFVTDDGHPKHPGDFNRHDGALRVFVDPRIDEAVIEFESGDEGSKETDRYFVRGGQVFQVDEEGQEIALNPLGDLSPATVAAIHPALIGAALLNGRKNAGPGKNGAVLFAWNDALWKVAIDRKENRVKGLKRRVFHDVFGDGTETVRFEDWRKGSPGGPGRVVVTLAGRETARFDYSAPTPVGHVECAEGDPARGRQRVVSPDEIRFDEIAPNLFLINLASQNTRVTVAEFADFVVVLEGVYNSRNCDLVAARVRERFGKPVRYFAFSHLHGQYIGGTRSWIHEGATILVPPSTAPWIEQIANASSDLRPDALSREAKPLKLETVPDRKRIEDGANTLDVYNVESGHTDEYFIFHFPKQKVLLTGDLLLYRPGQPLKRRSKQLCETVRKLGLDAEQYVATWPLDGYGTKNIVTGEEMRAACTE